MFSAFLLITCFVIGTQPSGAAPRHRPAYPGGVADPRGAAGPGVAGTRGVEDTRGVADARGVADTRAAARYTHALPAGYEARVYSGLNYYYSAGIYYYEYANDGPTIYVPAPVVGGVPTVPPRPYVYTLPAGYSIQSYAGVNYYDYYGYYYCVYYINGRAVYVLAPVVAGAPTVPPPPY